MTETLLRKELGRHVQQALTRFEVGKSTGGCHGD
jgi:hypothetical protein